MLETEIIYGLGLFEMISEVELSRMEELIVMGLLTFHYLTSWEWR